MPAGNAGFLQRRGRRAEGRKPLSRASRDAVPGWLSSPPRTELRFPGELRIFAFGQPVTLEGSSLGQGGGGPGHPLQHCATIGRLAERGKAAVGDSSDVPGIVT